MATGKLKTHPDLALFPVTQGGVQAIANSMLAHGYDESEPIVLWQEQGYIVDGHTRHRAAIDARLDQVAVIVRSFASWDEAIDYAIARQRDRRNLTPQDFRVFVVRAVQVRDKHKPRGGDHKSSESKAPSGAFDRGKSAADLAADLGTSTRTVERTRAVLASENEPVKQKLLEGEIAPSAAYEEVKQAQAAKVTRASYSVEQWAELTGEARVRLVEQGREGKIGLNGQKSDNIEWALWSWNPVTGCLHNCPYCYARDIANRSYPQKFAPTFLPERLGAPLHQGVPRQAQYELGYRNIFTCSMADLFGKWVPSEWIEAVLDVARDAPQWNFLFLTKFPNRLVEFEYPENVWLGTTVDCQARVKNAERSFERVRGGVKWLSVEPMLEPLTFESLSMFDWVVIGGASSSTKTPAWSPPRRWVDDLEHAAREAGCMIYEKTNLWERNSRLREYPGWERAEATLPSALKYLPSIG
jgi:protein gp37/ParB-like chromosome segregation protein Spo0J